MRRAKHITIALLAFLAVAPAAQEDRTSFLRWFTFLVESRYYAHKPLKGFNDTDGIVRWACRNALARHDPKWYLSLELPLLPAIPMVPVSPAVEQNECAEPRRVFVSRNISDAEPGDLLVFEPSENTPELAIYIGASQVLPTPEKWVIYQVASAVPRRNDVRRVTVESMSGSQLTGVWRLEILGPEKPTGP